MADASSAHRALDLRRELVCLTLTDGSHRVYRVSGLLHKCVGDVLSLALADPKCPLAGPGAVEWGRQYTGAIGLHELLVKGAVRDGAYKLNTLRALEPQERVLDVLTRWDADERVLRRAQRRASGLRATQQGDSDEDEDDEEEGDTSKGKGKDKDKGTARRYMLLFKRADDDTLRRRAEDVTRTLLPSGARELLDDVKHMRVRQRLEQRLTAKRLVAELSAYIDADTGRYVNGAVDGDAQRPLSVALSAAAAQALARGERVRAPTALVTALEHERLLLAWLNKHLRAQKLFVSNLHRDVRSGVALLRVLEALSGARLREYYRRPRDAQQCLQNLDLFLRFLERLRVPVVQGARAQHFYRGDMAVVVGQVFLLMRRVMDKSALRKHLQRRSQKAQMDKAGTVDLTVGRSQRFSILPTELQHIARQATAPSSVTPMSTLHKPSQQQHRVSVAPPSSAPPPPPDFVGGSLRVALEPRFSVRANAAHRSAIVLQSPLWQSPLNDELDDLSGWEEDVGDEHPFTLTMTTSTFPVSPIVSPRGGLSSRTSEIDIDALLDDDPRELLKLASRPSPDSFPPIALELDLDGLSPEAPLLGVEDEDLQELSAALAEADIDTGVSFDDVGDADSIIAELLAEYDAEQRALGNSFS